MLKYLTIVGGRGYGGGGATGKAARSVAESSVYSPPTKLSGSSVYSPPNKVVPGGGGGLSPLLSPRKGGAAHGGGGGGDGDGRVSVMDRVLQSNPILEVRSRRGVRVSTYTRIGECLTHFEEKK